MTPRRIRRPPFSAHRRYRNVERKTGNLVLIVCEGKTTEPSYFDSLRKDRKLTGLTIHGEQCGNDPRSVVDYAVQIKHDYEEKSRRGSELEFDDVWCVIDHDKHPTLKEAINRARDHNIRIALSVPCFEFWCLLYYEYTTAHFKNCEEVIRRLRNHLPRRKYSKSNLPCDSLLENVTIAVENGKRLRQHNEATDTWNPRTDVDSLVGQLLELK